MRPLILMSVLFLSGCFGRQIELDIPPTLTEPVIVNCVPGDTSRALGSCLIRLREGLNIANSKLGQIEEIVGPR